MQRSTKNGDVYRNMYVNDIIIQWMCEEKENVTLSVWGAEEDQEMLNKMVDAFEEKYKDEAEFNITICVENEVTCKETVLIDPKKAADIYSFADDQLASAVMNLDIQMEHEIVKKLREEMKTSQRLSARYNKVINIVYHYA